MRIVAADLMFQDVVVARRNRGNSLVPSERWLFGFFTQGIVSLIPGLYSAGPSARAKTGRGFQPAMENGFLKGRFIYSDFQNSFPDRHKVSSYPILKRSWPFLKATLKRTEGRSFMSL
jgi:hypothetical protein